MAGNKRGGVEQEGQPPLKGVFVSKVTFFRSSRCRTLLTVEEQRAGRVNWENMTKMVRAARAGLAGGRNVGRNMPDEFKPKKQKPAEELEQGRLF